MNPRVLLLLATVTATVLAAPQGSLPAERVYKPLPTGSITPKGWLLKQLELQAEGLSGHLSLFWNDVMNSIWIGGNGDGGLHERAPYWLNGLVPLAFLLNKTSSSLMKPVETAQKSADPLCKNGTDMAYGDLLYTTTPTIQACHDLCVNTSACIAFVADDCFTDHVLCWLKQTMMPQTQVACRCLGFVPPKPPVPVDLMSQALKYLNCIMDHQLPSGWLGPDDIKDGDQYWGNFNVLLSLIQYAEAEPAVFDKVTGVILKFMQEAYRRMQTVALSDWSAARGQDFALSIEWMIENAPQGQSDMLLDLLALTQKQTLNWESWFATFKDGSAHGVNNAQALKSSGVWYLATGDESFHNSSLSRLANMDKTYGMPSGMFCADEILCDVPEQKMPSRGTELCAVVEAMFSYNTLFSVHGDVVFADRAERIAYNAMPATWASPTGGDMWAHQYLQAVNEISAQHSDPHVWANDGPDSELYGLEPNYGCCTANFNQGWPKFANYLFFTTSDNGVSVGAFAPASAVLPSGTTIDMETTYPFDDVVTIVTAASQPLPVYVRIPHWANSAELTLNGEALPSPTNGTMYRVVCPIGKNTIVLTLKPEIRTESWFAPGTVSVHRGALMYSMPINGTFSVLNSYAFDSKDYQVVPTSPWTFAINTSSPMAYRQPGYVDGAAPFNHTNWPCSIDVTLRYYPGWGLEKGSAAAPPSGPVCNHPGDCTYALRTSLVPYGGTDLRISVMPIA